MGRTCKMVCVLLAAVGSASPAMGQNALGAGRALDANLQQGSGGLNTRGQSVIQPLLPTLNNDLSFRNAVVTGNARFGRSFRGEVGYFATDDFAGELNDSRAEFYQFERDSTSAADIVYSGLATRNLRGLTSVQNTLNNPLYGQTQSPSSGLVLRRPGTGAQARVVGQGDLIEAEIDRTDAIPGTLRSASASNLGLANSPALMGFDPRARGEPLMLTASGLMGLRSLPIDSTAMGAYQWQLDRADAAGASEEGEGFSVAGESEARVLTPHERVVNDLRIGLDRTGERVGSDTLGERVGGGPVGAPVTPRPAGAVNEAGAGSRVGEGADAGSADAVETSLDRIRSMLLQGVVPVMPGADDLETDPEGEPSDAEFERVLEEANELLDEENRRRLEHLYLDTETGVYGANMRAGEEALAERKWFTAEERFSAALRGRPGDAMAAAGRIHAQLGAGMYRSAASNLRNLFTAYPELLTQRYEERLLPRAERLERVRTQLRGKTSRDTEIGRDAALLLAYLGFQHENRADVLDGFAALERIDDATGGERKALIELVRTLWLDDAEQDTDE
ncbi:MAG: hypothetical protein AAGD00_00480 [Planctomycetota bacterium]